MKIKTEEIGGSAPVNATGSPIAGTDSSDPHLPYGAKRKPRVLRRIVPKASSKAKRHNLPVGPEVH
jgi:hypothetical protein